MLKKKRKKNNDFLHSIKIKDKLLKFVLFFCLFFEEPGTCFPLNSRLRKATAKALFSKNREITTAIRASYGNRNIRGAINQIYNFGNTYNSFSNPEYASGSNISISDTFTCSQITSTPGKYFIMVSDITQSLTSNAVPILITN